jgi:hypothetical protein
MMMYLYQSIFIRFFLPSFLVILIYAYMPATLTQGTIIPEHGTFSSAATGQNDNEQGEEEELSIYENPTLGFTLKYPSDFHIAEVTNSPESKTIVFRKISFAPETGAFLSVNATKWNIGITFDELKEIMSDTIRTGPGINILENDTDRISGIPVFKIVQSHANSPYGRDATAIFIGAVRNETSYIISSVSTDSDALQEIINSFAFMI